nr:hypothetical protein [Tanacetum cinerariifolium]
TVAEEYALLVDDLKVVYVLTTCILELLENDTNVESAKELWDSLESKYMAEMLLVRSSLILVQHTQYGLKMDESISVSSVIDNLPPSWKDLKHSLKHGYSNKNYVRKFFRALHSKWRAKVTAIEESKDLTSLSLEELIGNLKVHEMIIKKNFKIVKAKVERKFIALKAKKESSDEECLTFGSKDEEYTMAVIDFKKFFKEEMWRPESSYWRMSKTTERQEPKSFCRRLLDDSGEEDDEKVKDETCLVAHASSE